MKSKIGGELLEVLAFILGFLPWILFLFLPTDGWEPLRRTVAVCLFVSVVSAWKGLRKGFILQWATLLFFLFCTISFYVFHWLWLARQMGIIANAFLDGLIWLTVIVGKPFTLQYARADLPKEEWYDENLIHGCRFIAVFWGMLLLLPTVCNALQLFYPGAVSDRFSFYLSLSCIIAGIAYTTFYKRKKRRQRDSASARQS